MKVFLSTQRFYKTGLCLGALSLCLVGAEGQSQTPLTSWVDRAATNAPLVEQTEIDGSLEQFWNLPEPLEAEVGQIQRQNPKVPRGKLETVRNSVSMKQERETRGRRGFIGINLFNLIPIIDIVHGEVVEGSVDYVEGRK